MKSSQRLVLWGGVSVVAFAVLLYTQSVFGNLVVEADQGVGSPVAGTALLISAIVLGAGLVFTATMFFRSLLVTLEERRARE